MKGLHCQKPVSSLYLFCSLMIVYGILGKEHFKINNLIHCNKWFNSNSTHFTAHFSFSSSSSFLLTDTLAKYRYIRDIRYPNFLTIRYIDIAPYRDISIFPIYRTALPYKLTVTIFAGPFH